MLRPKILKIISNLATTASTTATAPNAKKMRLKVKYLVLLP